MPLKLYPFELKWHLITISLTEINEKALIQMLCALNFEFRGTKTLRDKIKIIHKFKASHIYNLINK